MQLAKPLLKCGRQQQQVTCIMPSRVTQHVTLSTSAEVDGDVVAAAKGGGAAAVHRKTRI